MTAIVIAVAGVVDPVLTREGAGRPAVLVRLLSTEGAAAERALAAALPDAELDRRSPAGDRLPCEPTESCIVIADGSMAIETATEARVPVSLVTTAPPQAPNVTVVSVTTPAAQHVAAAGSARVVLAGSGVEGRRTHLRILDSAATVGRADHDWTADGAVTLDVPWWPVLAGPRALSVEAVPIEGESSLIDNRIDVGAMVSAGRTPVLVFDPRPSWASTFVRRSLEDDPRFAVRHRARLGPSLDAGTAGAALDAATLAAVAIAVVSAPDALSANDAVLLDRFVRERGGTLILLPDRAPSGAAARLFSGQWSEHLSPSPVEAGPFRATEILRAEAAAPGEVVLAAFDGRPVVLVSPAGNGRIVVSGAIDAWRYRGGDGAGFDGFWRSLAAEFAEAGAALRMTLDQTIAAPGTDVNFTVRHFAMDTPLARSASAVVRCAGAPPRIVRLWPSGPSGAFAGRAAAEGEGACTVVATAGDDARASGGFSVMASPARGVSATLAGLERYAVSTGGHVVRAGDEAALAAHLAAGPAAPPMVASIHPMRSPWWLLPFAGCLAAEWWLRRRGGLR
jgi:hypothetical protein